MKKYITPKELFLLVFGMGLITFAVYYIMIPSGIVMGSLLGFIMVIENLIPLPYSVLSLVFNVSLFVIGYIVVGKEFGLKTFLCSLIQPVCLRIFEYISPEPSEFTGNLVIDLMCFMIVICYGQALLFSMNASSGGLDIPVRILNKFTGISIGGALSVLGIMIALSSAIFYDRTTVIISVAGTLLYGKVLDYYCDGYKVRKRICILSDQHEQIQKFILNDMHRGVTLYHPVGGFNQKQHIEIETILEKNECRTLLSFIQELDENAFVTVSTVNEMVGAWNKNKKKLIP